MISRTFVAGFLFAASACGSLFAADVPIPSRFLFKNGGDPIWVSAAEAITPSGFLRPEIYRRESLEAVLEDGKRERARRRAVSDAQEANDACDVIYTERHADDPGQFPVSSLEQLAEVARTREVISGVVTGLALGVHDVMPYTMVQIDPRPATASGERVYIMYPRGRLHFDGVTFCNNNPDFSELPALGDSITFVAAHSPVFDTTGTLFVTTGSWLLYERDGIVVPPPGLRLDPDMRSLESLHAVTVRLRSRPKVDNRQQR
jgi:hypothetical protein